MLQHALTCFYHIAASITPCTVAVSQCTIQCIGSNSPVVICENGTLVDDTFDSSACDLLVECSYSNITDALQCVAGINDSLATTTTSL